MTRTDDKPTPRVQVYFENPKTELALRREARAGKLTLSRAAEQAIARGLIKRPQADPEDRLLNLERGLRDHMRAMARDMTIVQELLVEFARAFFLRLPDTAADEDPLLRAAVEVRIERLLDAAAARIAGGGTHRSEEPQAPETRASEARSFTAAAE
jgi:hypothetical protein